MAIAAREIQQRVSRPVLPEVRKRIDSAFRGLRRLAFADEKKDEKKEGEKKSPIEGLTNTDPASPMRKSGSTEEAKTVVEEKKKKG